MWFDEIADQVAGEQLVNDSKTPSGHAHVGALRGVLIHDALYRVLRARGTPVTYRYGFDDYDPLDELPAAGGEDYRPYLGMPLCAVPAPPGSPAGDLAEHFAREFLDVFEELGVGAEVYRMRDVYRSGTFDDEIDIILRNSRTVRRIDREVAGTRRPDDWHPFQVICERCARIGTTVVHAYDGERVAYRCVPDLVRWASGCDHSGRVSPFKGNGKLPWKLEWAAKWKRFGVTIEGAGKDHNARGGSREVAARCLETILDRLPPRNVPYEFFLVGGSKMSSSRGVGVTAREMADLLPPALLRYLMIRARPNRTVDFEPERQKVVRLFDDYDRLAGRIATGQARPGEEELYALASVPVRPEPGHFAPPFSLLLSLVQLPHVDLAETAMRLKGGALLPVERCNLDRRITSARRWLARYGHPDDRLELAVTLPDEAQTLRPEQVEFLHRIAGELRDCPWEPEALQARIFATAAHASIGQADAFEAVYLVLFGRRSGPRAGSVLAVLDPAFVRRRFEEPLTTAGGQHGTDA